MLIRTRVAVTWLRLATLAALVLACDDNGPESDRYEATLSGANEVPATNSAATGTFTLTDRGDRMDFRLNVQEIPKATAAHIHAGAPDVNGGVLVTLFSTDAPLVTFSGTLALDSFTAADIVALPGALAPISMDSLRVLLRSNGAYVNVHTVAFPDGAIRGPIVRD